MSKNLLNFLVVAHFEVRKEGPRIAGFIFTVLRRLCLVLVVLSFSSFSFLSLPSHCPEQLLQPRHQLHPPQNLDA